LVWSLNDTVVLKGVRRIGVIKQADKHQ